MSLFVDPYVVITLDGSSSVHDISFPWISRYKCLSAQIEFPASSISLISIRSKRRGVTSEEFRLYPDDAQIGVTELKLPLTGEYEQVSLFLGDLIL